VVNGTDVDVFLTGIKLRGAEPGLSILLEKSPDVCISTGLAGGLQGSLGIGQIVAASGVSGLTEGELSFCNSELLQIARQCGAMIVERFVTSDRVLGTTSEKKDAARRGQVVEMEGFEVLNKASQKWIPTILVRSISDTANDTLPLDFNRTINSSGSISLFKIVVEVARSPRQIPALIEFGNRSRQAAATLADFLDRYIPAVSAARPVNGSMRQEVAER
jgi:nucleoside phosphorylase